MNFSSVMSGFTLAAQAMISGLQELAGQIQNYRCGLEVQKWQQWGSWNWLEIITYNKPLQSKIICDLKYQFSVKRHVVTKPSYKKKCYSLLILSGQ